MSSRQGMGQAGREAVRRHAVSWLGIAVALWLGVWCAGCAQRKKPEGPPEPPPLKIEDEIATIVESRGAGLGLVDTVGMRPTWDWLAKLYRDRHHHPYWGNGRRLRREATTLLETIRRTSEAGLDTADYDLEHLRRLMAQSNRVSVPAERVRPRTMARFDVVATYAVLRIAHDMRQGRVPRSSLDPDWVVDTLSDKEREAIARSLGHDPAAALTALEPGAPGYVRLRAALAGYREVAAQGGWGEIPPGPPLQPGDHGRRVAKLIRRLIWSNVFRARASDTVFDARLERAVGSLQARLGIPVSGVVGEATRAALNVPVERRIREMELNLERWRWLPDSLGARHIEVNIPAYRLELIRGDQVTRAMRVVVGRRLSPTPVFSDQLTYLELNPTWTVPPGLVVKEIVPALNRNHDYLAANHMLVVSIADAKRDTVDPHDVPWKDAAADTFHYLVVQQAGPDNPLGRIKLMCPNEYDVYLHDTPQRSRFSVAVRDYSHGCVRVEEALELADSLVAGMAGDTAWIDTLATSGEWKRLRFTAPLSVHFL